jgi:hypothetical protein
VQNIVWTLIIFFGNGGVDHIPTASEAACNAARTAMIEAMKDGQKFLNVNRDVRALTVAVCVPIEQRLTPAP